MYMNVHSSFIRNNKKPKLLRDTDRRGHATFQGFEKRYYSHGHTRRGGALEEGETTWNRVSRRKKSPYTHERSWQKFQRSDFQGVGSL